ncbi:MAG: hypothetical protein M9957_14955 [Rhodobacteraceae bacterium]|nr:hypothetical protein [Paracoccaceae bacterium]
MRRQRATTTASGRCGDLGRQRPAPDPDGRVLPWNNVGIELLAATPFEHTATISGVGTATTKHLPPTLSLVYHIPTAGKVTPFVGAGSTTPPSSARIRAWCRSLTIPGLP